MRIFDNCWATHVCIKMNTLFFIRFIIIYSDNYLSELAELGGSNCCFFTDADIFNNWLNCEDVQKNHRGTRSFEQILFFFFFFFFSLFRKKATFRHMIAFAITFRIYNVVYRARKIEKRPTDIFTRSNVRSIHLSFTLVSVAGSRQQAPYMFILRIMNKMKKKKKKRVVSYAHVYVM